MSHEQGYYELGIIIQLIEILATLLASVRLRSDCTSCCWQRRVTKSRKEICGTAAPGSESKRRMAVTRLIRLYVKMMLRPYSLCSDHMWNKRCFLTERRTAQTARSAACLLSEDAGESSPWCWTRAAKHPFHSLISFCRVCNNCLRIQCVFGLTCI